EFRRVLFRSRRARGVRSSRGPWAARAALRAPRSHRSSAGRPPAARRGSAGTPPRRRSRCQWSLLKLIISALARRLVLAPAAQLRAVADAPGGDVVGVD